MMKSDYNKAIGKSREAQAPKEGDRVLYPVPFPPVSHVKLDREGDPTPEWSREPGIDDEGNADPTIKGKRNPDYDVAPWCEVAVPTGDEEWHPAEVIELQTVKKNVEADQHLALIQPLDGDTGEPFSGQITVPVVMLKLTS